MGTLSYVDEFGVWHTSDDPAGSGGGSGGVLTDNSVITRYIANGAVTNPKIVSMDAAKLTGSLNGSIIAEGSVPVNRLSGQIDWGNLTPDVSQHIQDALSLATNSSKTYYTPNPPVGNEGDVWFDSDNGNEGHIYHDGQWVSIRDEAINDLATASGKSKVYAQNTEPSGGVYFPGDVWFDTSDDNKVKVFDGSNWVSVSDTRIDQALNIANSKNTVFYQSTMPVGQIYQIGDLWFDTANNYRQYVYTSGGWVLVADAFAAKAVADQALLAANGRNKTIYSSNTPSGTGFVTGDQWFQYDGSGIYRYFRYDGSWKEMKINDTVLGNIDAAKIVTGFLSAARIQAGSITGDKIAANTITASNIATGTITAESGVLANASIGSAQIQLLAVTDAHIQNLTGYKIVADTIEGIKLRADSITSRELSVGAITAEKAVIANAAIVSANIAAAAIGTAQIADLAVTNAKIANINADKITTGYLSAARIQANSITLSHLAANVGSGIDISSNTSITSRVTTSQFNSAVNNLVKLVQTEYYSSSSATELIGGTWVSAVPASNPERFIWTRTKTTFANDSVTYSAGAYVPASSEIDINVGGRNLLANSWYLVDTRGTFLIGTNYSIATNSSQEYNGNPTLVVTGTGPGVLGTQSLRNSLHAPLVIGQNLTLSFYVRGTTGTGKVTLNGATASNGVRQFNVGANWTKVVIDMGLVATTTEQVYLEYTFDTAGTFYINSLKLEYGTSETDWSPAPEDLASMITANEDRIKSAEQIINGDSIINRVRNTSWYAEDLSNKADTNDLDNLQTTMESQFSEIEQTATGIQLSVTQMSTKIGTEIAPVVNNVATFFTFEESGLSISKPESPYSVKLDNDSLDFVYAGNVVAYLSNNAMMVKDGKFDRITFGAHTATKENGVTVFRWIG